MQIMTIAPGIVEMRDASNQTYLVDESLADILMNRKVWTDEETGHLMIEDMSYRQKNTITRHRLADWWYRIMTLTESRDLNIGFRDGNKRNLVYTNLVRLPKEFTRHDSTGLTSPQP